MKKAGFYYVITFASAVTAEIRYKINPQLTFQQHR